MAGMKKNVVSVLLPFFNASETLEKAITSIQEQTFCDFELILINNNADAASQNIAMQAQKKDSRIIVIDEPRQGIVYALNKGISLAKGKYIARMDSDDISFANRLQEQVNFLEKNQDVGLVASQAMYKGDKIANKGFYAYVQWSNSMIVSQDIALNRFVESPIIHPTIMMQKKILDEYGYYKQGDFPEDYELWLRLLYHRVVIAKIPKILLAWQDSAGRLTRVEKRYSTNAFFRIKAQYLAQWLAQNNPYHPEIVVWGNGRVTRKRVKYLINQGIKVKFYVDIVPSPHQNVLLYKEIDKPGKYFIVSFVRKRGAGSFIREYLSDLQYVEGVDFIMAA